MSDLWTLATADLEVELAERRLLAARQAAAPAWTFLAGAVSRGDFENRRALVAEQLDKAAQTVTDAEPVHYLTTRVALEDSFLQDFEALHTERQAEEQARNAHRAYLRAQEAAARKKAERLAKVRKKAEASYVNRYGLSEDEITEGMRVAIEGVKDATVIYVGQDRIFNMTNWDIPATMKDHPSPGGMPVLVEPDIGEPQIVVFDSLAPATEMGSLATRKTAAADLNEFGQPWAPWEDDRLEAAVSDAIVYLASGSPTAQDVVNRLGKAFASAGGYQDSIDREHAFTLAAQATGIDYEAIYDAWLAFGSDWGETLGSRRAQRQAASDTCPACEGRGQTMSEAPCQRCGGSGRIQMAARRTAAWTPETAFAMGRDAGGTESAEGRSSSEPPDEIKADPILLAKWRDGYISGRTYFTMTSSRRTAAKPPSRRAGDDAYVYPAHDSTVRQPVAPGTVANPAQGYLTWMGTKVYDWSIDGLGDGLQLGGTWTEIDGGSASGTTSARHTAGNPYPVGSSAWFEWEANPTPEEAGPRDSGAPGGGIPLHGPLSPEQEEWMNRRGGSRRQAQIVVPAQEIAVGDKINTASGPSAVVAIEHPTEVASYGFPTTILEFRCGNGEVLRFAPDDTLQVVAARSDYDHWNEDADYVWYQEEGRHIEEEDPDEFYDDRGGADFPAYDDDNPDPNYDDEGNYRGPINGESHFSRRATRRRASATELGGLDDAVEEMARSEVVNIQPGDRFGNVTVTQVGTHTVQYRSDDGWEGALQIPFVDHMGQPLPSRQRALTGSRRTAAKEVHTFPDTQTGYNQTQGDEAIKDGDVLLVPNEQVAGFLLEAWPVAVTEAFGSFHQLTDPTKAPAGYEESYEQAVKAATDAGWAINSTAAAPETPEAPAPAPGSEA